jgi:hypothetical protein
LVGALLINQIRVHQLIHHRIAQPEAHEFGRDKVDSGVTRLAEFNGCIPIVIGHQEEVQNREFVYWL